MFRKIGFFFISVSLIATIQYSEQTKVVTVIKLLLENGQPAIGASVLLSASTNKILQKPN